MNDPPWLTGTGTKMVEAVVGVCNNQSKSTFQGSSKSSIGIGTAFQKGIKVSLLLAFFLQFFGPLQRSTTAFISPTMNFQHVLALFALSYWAINGALCDIAQAEQNMMDLQTMMQDMSQSLDALPTQTITPQQAAVSFSLYPHRVR
jgi:hypothetical protein